VVGDEKLEGIEMVGQLFGKRQDFAHQTGNPLSQGVVDRFNVIGFPGFLRVALCRATGITPS
jgi:hypothetical protein